ncbi:putative RNase H-like HicB family nuclease [Bradyrhizobium sp. USDA 372]
MTNRLTVVVEQGERGLWYATSPDEKGLLAVGKTPALAVKQASWALLDLERARKVLP